MSRIPFVSTARSVHTNTTLSFGARVTFGTLTWYGYRAGRSLGDTETPIDLPPMEHIAVEVGCSVPTLKRFFAELRASRNIVTRRAGPRGLRCFLFDVSATPETVARLRKDRSDSAHLSQEDGSSVIYQDGSPVSHQAGALLITEEVSTRKESLTGFLESPVPGVHIAEGQNEPLNALREACGIDPANGARMGELAAALCGRGGREGIRDLFWIECRRVAEQTGREAKLAEITPEQYASLLVERIWLKARQYVERMPENASLTPSALRKWWLDLERMKPREGGMTPEEVKRVADAA